MRKSGWVRISVIIFVAAWLGCSSAPVVPTEPAWVKAPVRTVDAGYIVYVGTGEDATPENARFKAEGMALQDLANECSFAPKGTRIEDRYDEVVASIHRTYAKVAIEFQDCEAAKQAVTPESIQKLANVSLASELKRYQDAVDAPTPLEAPPAVASNGSDANSSSGLGLGSGRPTVVIRQAQDPASFFFYRQQVAYYKQVVILQPPGSVAPPPVIAAIPTAQRSVATYERVHPETRTWPNAYSAVQAARVNALKPAKADKKEEKSKKAGKNRGRRKRRSEQRRHG